MNKQHEKILVATLAGLVIAGAATFAVQPAMAAGYHVDAKAQVTGVSEWDRLNFRKWPAPHSQKLGSFAPYVHVWVERCVETKYGADWCLVERNNKKGWVNSNYLTIDYDY